MIPANHPVVRVLAEKAACDQWNALSDRCRTVLTLAEIVEAQLQLLTDMYYPATRDMWIRWGRKRAFNAVLNSTYNVSIDGRQTTWNDAIRDNPDALEAAVCAALETL